MPSQPNKPKSNKPIVANLTLPIALQQNNPTLINLSLKTRLSYSLKLMKPITWFAPMWAFLCGAVAAGMNWGSFENIFKLVLGILMSGPILCGLSQVLNDWFDREVDAINEPQRLIPSGKVSGNQVLVITIILSIIGVAIPVYLGEPVIILAALGFILALMYSVHPVRAKRNGWIGNLLVAVSYEGLPWLAGSATFGVNNTASWSAISSLSLIAAAIYSFGAHGIMTINDFKSVKGDIIMKINTIPVLHGEKAAAWIAVTFINLAQIAMTVVLFLSGKWLNALIVLLFLLVQLPLQRIFIHDPKERAIFYNSTGTTVFVYGMLVTAISIGIS